MRIDIITLFPDMFVGPLSQSIIGRAVEKALVSINLVDLREFCEGKHRQADDAPYGGGPGMVLMAGPVFDAVESLSGRSSLKRIILTSAQGALFNQAKAREFSIEDDLVIICGRYEGVDERVALELATDEISIGDYVLTGGEFAALVMIDAVCRLTPGVVGSPESLEADSFAGDLLGHPQYTRPPAFGGMAAPEVLLSGNHAEIAKWRRREAIRKTFDNRSELLAGASLTEEEREFVRGLEREAEDKR
jgi:tRNA (guanine37-N1)-methyltransferase